MSKGKVTAKTIVKVKVTPAKLREIADELEETEKRKLNGSVYFEGNGFEVHLELDK